MDAFNKEQSVCDIKLGLRRIRVTHILELLEKCGVPPIPKVGSFHDVYLQKRLDAASVHQLAALSAIIKSKYSEGSFLLEKYSLFQDSDQLRVFISHSAHQEEEAQALKEQLEYGGVECFVAGEDIATASEWLVEIVTQLEHMDVLITLVSENSVVSPTCNQEVGFALGAGKPVLSVMDQLPPAGLIGSMQAIERKEGDLVKDVALEVISALMRLPHLGPQLTSILVRQLVAYDQPRDSFKVIGFCRKALATSPYLLAGQIFELRRAAQENAEIARFASGRGPELIESLCQEFEEKNTNLRSG